jgi:hypothetical protein
MPVSNRQACLPCLQRKSWLHKIRKINQVKKILKAGPPLVTGEVPTGGGVHAGKTLLHKPG